METEDLKESGGECDICGKWDSNLSYGACEVCNDKYNLEEAK